jgi:hypothetical protein
MMWTHNWVISQRKVAIDRSEANHVHPWSSHLIYFSIWTPEHISFLQRVGEHRHELNLWNTKSNSTTKESLGGQPRRGQKGHPPREAMTPPPPPAHTLRLGRKAQTTSWGDGIMREKAFKPTPYQYTHYQTTLKINLRLDEFPKQENNDLCCISHLVLHVFHLSSKNSSAHNCTQESKKKESQKWLRTGKCSTM